MGAWGFAFACSTPFTTTRSVSSWRNCATPNPPCPKNTRICQPETAGGCANRIGHCDRRTVWPQTLSQEAMSGSMPFVRLDNYDPSGSDYGRPKFVVFLWYLFQETLFRYSPVPCYGFRRWLLKLFGCKLGQGGQGASPGAAALSLAHRDRRSCRPSATMPGSIPSDTIKIGDHSVISQKSFLCTASHDYRDPRFRLTHQPITVGNGVWIAADVYVAPGVTIGDNAVIGARSSVFHDMPPGMVCYGYPCRAHNSGHLNRSLTGDCLIVTARGQEG